MVDRTRPDGVIEPTPPFLLAALPQRGASAEIGGAFDRLYAWAGPRGLIGPQTRSIGVYLDDPESVPRAQLRSYAGMTVPPGFAAEGEIEIVEIPGGEVAAIVHKGPYAELEAVYRGLYKGWLPQSGREPADAPPFEEYLNDPRATPPVDWLTKVCLPLEAQVAARA
ncbi:MAG: AraC family transcriptional regulator, partial [Salinarimonas sp.]